MQAGNLRRCPRMNRGEIRNRKLFSVLKLNRQFPTGNFYYL
jgi:hypothetical protein